MVSKGQFLERPTLIPVGDVVLEAMSHRGDKRPPLLIVAPTPEEGGSMDHVVAAEVAWAAATRGYPTLRFNFQGVGGSQGKRQRGAALVSDTEEALRLLGENAGTMQCVLLSIGGSAQTILEVQRRHPAVAGLCFVSPIELEPDDLLGVNVPLRVIVGALDLRQARVALAAAVTEAGGQVEIIDEADQAFTRNLTEVGRHVASFLASLGGL